MPLIASGTSRSQEGARGSAAARAVGKAKSAGSRGAAGIAENVVKAVNDSAFNVVIVNFANADMVGHSGKMAPTVKAVEVVDFCMGQIYDALRRKGGRWIITADHGNAEMMIDPVTGGPHTYHTTNPVPFIVVDEARRVIVGATFTGQGVAELLHSATIAVAAEVTLDRLWHAVPSFPTVSEVWLRLLEAYGL